MRCRRRRGALVCPHTVLVADTQRWWMVVVCEPARSVTTPAWIWMVEALRCCSWLLCCARAPRAAGGLVPRLLLVVAGDDDCWTTSNSAFPRPAARCSPPWVVATRVLLVEFEVGCSSADSHVQAAGRWQWKPHMIRPAVVAVVALVMGRR